MVAVLIAALTLAGPPRAYVAAPAGNVPLVISSWCWGTRCGAPITAAKRVAVLPRNSTLRIVLKFAPTQVRLAVAGTPVTPAVAGDQISWQATHGGGITLTVHSRSGWVTYVGRLRTT